MNKNPSLNIELLRLSQQIKSLADTGLVYQKNGYDAERYEQLKDIAIQMQSLLSDVDIQKLKNFYLPEKDYPTPKVDVRAFVLNAQNEILMVKESVDSKWTLPGGWADIGLTPAESIIKEVEEETGYQVKPIKLLAVYDKKCYPHPPQSHYVYKLIFLCKMLSGEVDPNFDIQGVQWFSISKLPELSTDRILKNQIEHLYELTQKDLPTFFDGM
tara:strand:+ start:634 stop:1275 length:642 start_codon:yes stop_codon:yes gene_type:complete